MATARKERAMSRPFGLDEPRNDPPNCKYCKDTNSHLTLVVVRGLDVPAFIVELCFDNPEHNLMLEQAEFEARLQSSLS